MPERTSLRRKRLSLARLSSVENRNYTPCFLHDIVLDTAKTSNTAVILTVSCVTPAQGLAERGATGWQPYFLSPCEAITSSFSFPTLISLIVFV